MLQIVRYEDALERGAFALNGTVTNIVWSAEELKKRIEQGSLYLEEIPAGRLWFCCSGTRNQLYFQTDPEKMDTLRRLSSPHNCVSELIFTDAQRQKAENAGQVLNRLGYTKESTALFMSFTKKDETRFMEYPCSGVRCRKADMDDISRIRDLFEQCFDKLTDDIPDESMLEEEVRTGNVNVAYSGTEERDIIGCILLEKHHSRTLIRHVSVEPAWRRKGVAKTLVGKALDGFLPGERGFLWVKEDNPAAVNLYKHFGFEISGRKMEIWTNREG